MKPSIGLSTVQALCARDNQTPGQAAVERYWQVIALGLQGELVCAADVAHSDRTCAQRDGRRPHDAVGLDPVQRFHLVLTD